MGRWLAGWVGLGRRRRPESHLRETAAKWRSVVQIPFRPCAVILVPPISARPRQTVARNRNPVTLLLTRRRPICRRHPSPRPPSLPLCTGRAVVAPSQSISIPLAHQYRHEKRGPLLDTYAAEPRLCAPGEGSCRLGGRNLSGRPVPLSDSYAVLGGRARIVRAIVLLPGISPAAARIRGDHPFEFSGLAHATSLEARLQGFAGHEPVQKRACRFSNTSLYGVGFCTVTGGGLCEIRDLVLDRII